jgi:hypothetical protein
VLQGNTRLGCVHTRKRPHVAAASNFKQPSTRISQTEPKCVIHTPKTASRPRRAGHTSTPMRIHIVRTTRPERMRQRATHPKTASRTPRRKARQLAPNLSPNTRITPRRSTQPPLPERPRPLPKKKTYPVRVDPHPHPMQTTRPQKLSRDLLKAAKRSQPHRNVV